MDLRTLYCLPWCGRGLKRPRKRARAGRLGIYLQQLSGGVLLAGWACSLQTASASSDLQSFAGARASHPDVTRVRQFKDQGGQLRHLLNDIPHALRQGTPVGLDHKKRYVALQAGLIHLAETHTPAILDEKGPGGRPALLHLSLAVMATSEWLANFHALAAARNVWPASFAEWSGTDSIVNPHERGQSVARAVPNDPQTRRLFGTMLHALRQRQSELEALWSGGDQDVRMLYPGGVERGLNDAEQQLTLLLARMGEEDLDRDMRDAQSLMDRSTASCARWVDTAAALQLAIESEGGMIRGDTHVRIHAVAEDYLLLRRDLYRVAFKHLPKLTRVDIPYPETFRVRSVGLALLAAMTLYDNAHCLLSHFGIIPGMRQLLNQGDPARQIPSGFWDQVEREFARPESRALVHAGLRTISQALAQVEKREEEGDPFLTAILRRATTNSTAVSLGDEGDMASGWLLFDHYRKRIHQWEASLVSWITLNLSKVFGNLVGLVEFRHGKLAGNEEWTRFVRDRLQPGDLLVEKTPFRLTDVLIPGHFGHVALYVGNEEELQAMGLLSHPLVAPHRDDINEGHSIVEALRDGTQINTLEHFLNVDDLAILRPKPDMITRQEVGHAITLAFSHIGKSYDFGFSTSTWDTIICSELAFDTYVDVRWPFGKAWNRYTISPDDVASLAGALPSQPFELVTFIHDGQVVHDRPTGVLAEESYVHILNRGDTPSPHLAWSRQ